MTTKIKDYGLLYFAFIIYSFVSVFAKIASGQSELWRTLLFMFIECFFLGVYALIWQQALKRSMSNKGVTVVLGLLWSVFLFGESITIMNIVGAVLIIFGIWMVSSDD